MCVCVGGGAFGGGRVGVLSQGLQRCDIGFIIVKAPLSHLQGEKACLSHLGQVTLDLHLERTCICADLGNRGNQHGQAAAAAVGRDEGRLGIVRVGLQGRNTGRVTTSGAQLRWDWCFCFC